MDPFADLFTSSSSDLFRSRIQSTTTSTNVTTGNTPVPGTPTLDDEFGSFISVPPSLDPLHQPEPFSPIVTSPINDAFVIAAKQRHEQNERRVLDELLLHQDDPLYWVNTEDKTGEELLADLLGEEGPPSPPPSPQARGRTITPVNDQERSTPHRTQSTSSVKSTSEDNPSSSRSSSAFSRRLARNSISTLPRKFTSLLSSSLPSPPTASSPLFEDPSPLFSSSLNNSSVRSLTESSSAILKNPFGSASNTPYHTHRPLPSVTHVNPFSFSQLPYSPPSGAPGFVPSPTPDHNKFEIEAEKLGPLSLKGRKENTSPVLTDELAQAIRVSLPPLSRLPRAWSLLYSLDQHGISLSTFYKLSAPSSQVTAMSNRKGALIVVQDTDEAIFGVWLGDGIHLGQGGHYGGGDSFLWKEVAQSQQRIKLFKWTGRNDYVALCENDFISFGGGEDGKTGLYLDRTLLSGTSAKCRTFDNDILCGEASDTEPAPQGMDIPSSSGNGGSSLGTIKFEVLGLEVWGMSA